MDQDALPRFTLPSFLHDKLPALALALCAIGFTILVLVVLRAPFDAIVLAGCVLVGALALALGIDYARRRRFWNDLGELVASLDQARYFEGLENETPLREGDMAQELVSRVAHQAEAEIVQARALHSAQREYNELWVHEVKTPLAAAQLLASKLHGNDAARLKYELERIEGLISQALYAARADSLVNDYVIRDVALAECVTEACKANMHYLTARNVSLDISIDPDMHVIADKTWLSFILVQLITNAAKYDARTITFRVMPAPEEGAHACTILEIADDGCGIPASDVPRVFDRGFTGEVGRAHGSATGMGLYLAARMCAQMGLGIMLASEEGTGTRVEISFPHDRRKIALEHWGASHEA